MTVKNFITLGLVVHYIFDIFALFLYKAFRPSPGHKYKQHLHKLHEQQYLIRFPAMYYFDEALSTTRWQYQSQV
jgi:hypothetical protein